MPIVWGAVVLPDLYIFFFEHHIFTSSDHFLIFWNLNAMALHAFVQAMTPICLKICSNLLRMELTRTQVQKYDFFKPLWLAVACACSSNLNYGH